MLPFTCTVAALVWRVHAGLCRLAEQYYDAYVTYRLSWVMISCLPPFSDKYIASSAKKRMERYVIPNRDLPGSEELLLKPATRGSILMSHPRSLMQHKTRIEPRIGSGGSPATAVPHIRGGCACISLPSTLVLRILTTQYVRFHLQRCSCGCSRPLFFGRRV